MRLFFDSNMLTYIALFEGFLLEGEVELPDEVAFWTTCQPEAPDENVMREVHALRALYWVDEQARFDFLFSDLGLDEILAIRNPRKRAAHQGLLSRMIEHRHDVYSEEGRRDVAAQREAMFAPWSTQLPIRMHNDGRQYAEAEVVESDYFLTNDGGFITRAERLGVRVLACRPSDLPFLREYGIRARS
jgi:hypothetical protein